MQAACGWPGMFIVWSDQAMKTFFYGFCLLCAIAVVQVGSAEAFQCDGKVISKRNTKFDVLRKCGEPDYIDSWEEERAVRGYGRFEMPRSGGIPETQVPIVSVIHVQVERWTYNLGPNRFMQVLRFENGKLVDIDTGDYGD
jgi:hypothetical protein